MTKEMKKEEQTVFVLDDEFLVTQDNKLITSKYDMTAMEQKMLLILISTIRKESSTIPSTIFRVKDLATLLNVSEELLYRDLPKICKKIVSRVLEIKLDNGDWEMFNIISYAKYYSNKGSLQLDIHEKAEPYLLQLKELFSSYQLKNVLFLSSKYSIRVYQLTKSNAYKKSFIISIDELKDMLKLTQKSYNEYSNIKLKVLTPAISEINNKTNLNIRYEEIKNGRKVEMLKFYVSNSKPTICVGKDTDKKLKFNNFEARDYNYDAIEELALGNSEYDESKLYK